MPRPLRLSGDALLASYWVCHLFPSKFCWMKINFLWSLLFFVPIISITVRLALYMLYFRWYTTVQLTGLYFLFSLLFCLNASISTTNKNILIRNAHHGLCYTHLQAKGNHDHPRPEPKASAEARRMGQSALKTKMPRSVAGESLGLRASSLQQVRFFASKRYSTSTLLSFSSR